MEQNPQHMNKANHLGAEAVNTNCSVSPHNKYLYLNTEKIHKQKDNHLARLTRGLDACQTLEARMRVLRLRRV